MEILLPHDFNTNIERVSLYFTIVIRKRNSLETPRNRAVILVDTIVPIFEVEFTTNGPPNLHTFKKQHDVEVFVDMIENGNFDEEEFTNEYCKMVNTVRFLSTS